MALEALRAPELGRTTQLTSFALGDSVARLLGTVTLTGTPVSSLRLALRGAAIGAAFGACALALVVARRGAFFAPDASSRLAASPSREFAAPGDRALLELQTLRTWTPEDVRRAVQTGEGPYVLRSLEEAAKQVTDEATRFELTRTRVQALMLLGRRLEAEQTVTQALSRASQEQAAVLKALLKSE